jgi:hypothetical protein
MCTVAIVLNLTLSSIRVRSDSSDLINAIVIYYSTINNIYIILYILIYLNDTVENERL